MNPAGIDEKVQQEKHQHAIMRLSKKHTTLLSEMGKSLE